MSEEEKIPYKESTITVGQLYPVLKSKDGTTIDGFHRLKADPNWRTETLENIDTPEKIITARLVANKCRREVDEDEVRKWFNDLAEIYAIKGIEKGKISGLIAKNTPYSIDYIIHLLDQKYKREDLATKKAVLIAPSIEESTEGGPHFSVESFFSDAIKHLPNLPDNKITPEAKAETLYLLIKQTLNDEIIKCPHCGETRIQWRCGHEF